MSVEEMFPATAPTPASAIVELSTTFHTQVVGANGQRQAMFIERVEARRGHPAQLPPVAAGRDDRLQRPGGRRRQPDRDGHGRAARGLRHAVTSVASPEAAIPGHSSGTRLLDHADVVVDLGTPIGDALILSTASRPRSRPGSSVAGVAVVNEIKVRHRGLLVARGGMPVLTSGSVVGNESPRVCSTRRTTSTRAGWRGRAHRKGGTAVRRPRRMRVGILIAAVSLAAAACGGGGGGEAPSSGAGSGKTDNFVIGVSNTLAGNGWRGR